MIDVINFILNACVSLRYEHQYPIVCWQHFIYLLHDITYELYTKFKSIQWYTGTYFHAYLKYVSLLII